MKYIVAILILSAILTAPSLNKPDMYWECLNLSAAQNIIEKDTPGMALFGNRPLLLIHPPSMAYLIATARHLLGKGFWAARFPGFCIFILTGFMLWLLIRKLGYTLATAHAAALIYLTNPFALQGMLNLDFADGSLLPMSVVLFILVGVTIRSKRFITQAMLLGLCLCLMLWSKITSAVVFVIAYLIASIVENKKEKDLKLCLAVLFTGGISFLLTWFLYCLHLKGIVRPGGPSLNNLFQSPFEYLLSGGAAASAWELPLHTVALNILRFFFYTGPMLIMLSILQIFNWAWQGWKTRELPDHSIIPIFCLGILLGYSTFLGGVGAFPKYYLPGLPFLAMFCAVFLAKEEISIPRNKALVFALVSILVTLYYVFGVGDNVYVLNYELRAAAYHGEANIILKKLIIGQVFYFLPFLFVLILYFLFRRPFPIRLWFFHLLVLSQVSLCLIQGFSDYSLRYTYGVSYKDFREIQHALQGLKPKSSVMGDRMFALNANFEVTNRYLALDWGSLDSINQVIREQRPDAIIYGLPVNTIQQVKAIERNHETQSLLFSDYKLRKIGMFWLWLKKS